MLPILYQTNDFILYSYPLFMGLGWGIAYQIYTHLAYQSLSVKKAQFIFWGIFIFAWIGAKLLFYVTLPEHLSHNLISSASFWMGGGFVFYGGFLGGVVFLALARLIKFKITMNELWPILPALSFGHGVGRLGCLLAGCCFGNPTSWWWGVHMHGADRHPTQLLEAIGLIIIGFIQIKLKLNRMTLVMLYLVSYGSLRFFIEILRGDEIRGHWGLLTPSQWISLALVLIGSTLALSLRNQVLNRK